MRARAQAPSARTRLRKPGRSHLGNPGGEADSVAAPRAYRRKIEIERIDPDCFLAFQTFREFSLMDFFFSTLVMIILNSKELIFSSILKKSLDSEDTGSINYTL